MIDCSHEEEPMLHCDGCVLEQEKELTNVRICIVDLEAKLAASDAKLTTASAEAAEWMRVADRLATVTLMASDVLELSGHVMSVMNLRKVLAEYDAHRKAREEKG